MTQLLIVVGVFVFFISVYGAVLVGGHLLAELDHETAVVDPHLPAPASIAGPELPSAGLGRLPPGDPPLDAGPAAARRANSVCSCCTISWK